MASVTILNKPNIVVKNLERNNFSKISVQEKDNKNITINEFLAFRIKIIDKDIVSFGVNNVPGVGLQIIGVSNYIL